MTSPHEYNADRLRLIAPIHPPENPRTGLEVGFLTLPVPSWTARGPPFCRHALARCSLLLHW